MAGLKLVLGRLPPLLIAVKIDSNDEVVMIIACDGRLDGKLLVLLIVVKVDSNDEAIMAELEPEGCSVDRLIAEKDNCDEALSVAEPKLTDSREGMTDCVLLSCFIVEGGNWDDELTMARLRVELTPTE